MTSTPRTHSVVSVVSVLSLAAAVVVLTMLAVDLLRWDRQVESDDAAYVAGVDIGSWSASTALPASVSRTLLGLDDDLAYRRAVRGFWASKPRAAIRQFDDVTRRSAAEREVASVSDSDPDPLRRAQLLVMRGVLLLEEARNSPVQREVFARRAIEQFKRAATIDPANADAVYDLELALKLLRRTGSEQGGGGDARSPNPESGAGAATSGGGL